MFVEAALIYPIFIFTFIIFLSIYKYSMVGGIEESYNNYRKAQLQYEMQWKKQNNIRKQKLKHQKQIEKMQRCKNEKNDERSKKSS
jgi:hypothetical protein